MSGMQVRKVQLLQHPPHLCGGQPDVAAEAGDDLAGREVVPLLLRTGLPVVGEEQFAGGVGCLEPAVVVVELVDFLVFEPISEPAVEQRLGLRVDGVVVERLFPGVVDVGHFEDQPAAVAGVVGEEQRVVAGRAKGGDVRQAHLVAPVGHPLVDVERGGHRLELVQLGRAHGVDLLEIDQQELREGEQVVFAEPLAVGLCREIAAQAGRQEVLHEGGLVAPLTAYEHEYDLVDHPFVQRACQERHDPAAEAEGEAFGAVVGRVYLGGKLADGVAGTVPGGQRVQVVGERMELSDEVAGEQCAEAEQVCMDAGFLHGAPERVFDGVAHALPQAVALQLHLRLLGQPVAPDIHVTLDEALHRLHRGLLRRPSGGGARLEIFQPAGAMFGSERIAAFHCGADRCGVIIGESGERPFLRILAGDTEAVHPIKATADIIIVAMCAIFYTFALDKRTNRLFGLLGRAGAGRPSGFGSLLFLLLFRQRERKRVGAVERVGRMADDRHAGGVFAFRVVADAGQAGIMGVDLLPGKREELLRDGLFHAGEYPDAGTGDGGMRQEGVRVFPDKAERLGKLSGRDAVDIDHDESGVAGDVGGGTSAVERDGGGKGGLVLLDPFLLLLQFLEEQGVAGLFRLLQGGEGLPVLPGRSFVVRACQFADEGLPGNGNRSRAPQGGETAGAEWVMCLIHVLNRLLN